MSRKAWALFPILFFIAAALSCHAADDNFLAGQTRDQVLARLGKPTSTLHAGAREVLIFSNCRLTLTNGIVIKGELIVAPNPEPTIHYHPLVTPAPKEIVAMTVVRPTAPNVIYGDSSNSQKSGHNESSRDREVSQLRRTILYSGIISVSVLAAVLALRTFLPRTTSPSLTDSLLSQPKPPA